MRLAAPFRRRVLRFSLLCLGAFLVAGLVAPFVSANRLGHRIQQGLEASLGRKVEIGEAHFSLFAGPGFAIDNVTISEDPRYGIEPCAFVTSLEAQLRIDKLLLGKLEFSRLHFVEPSLNLVKADDGTWNFVELIERLGRERDTLSFFPTVEISDGRVDFKFGTRKTTFFLAGSDISIYPERSGKLHLRFNGSPARTDRAGRGFGVLNGTADWNLNASADPLKADITLERSNLSEIVTLFEGYDIGIHGYVSSHAVIEGPIASLRVKGSLNLEDVHRWDLLPSHGDQWRVSYKGNLDAVHRKLDLETAQSGEVPLQLRVQVNDFLTQPSWSLLAQLHRAPAEKLFPLATRMGIAVPNDLKFSGELEGAVSYSNRAGFDGTVSLNQAKAILPSAGSWESEQVVASVSDEGIHIAPSEVALQSGDKFQVSGDYNPGARKVDIALRTDAARIDEVTKVAKIWFASAPVLESFRQGTFSGQVRYQSEPDLAPLWSGRIQISDAVLDVPGVTSPVRNLAALASLNQENVEVSRFTGEFAGAKIQGQYRYLPLATHPERLRLEIASADINKLEELFAPTLQTQGLLARFRLGRRALPSWLRTRKLEADVIVNELLIPGAPVASARAHLLWEGSTAKFSAVRMKWAEATVHGTLILNLVNNLPRYRFTGRVEDYAWKRGRLTAAGRFDTSGLGSDFVRNLRSAGTFTGEDIALSQEMSLEKAEGRFNVRFDDGWPNLTVSQAEAMGGGESWEGKAVSQRDGKFMVDLKNVDRQIRVVSDLNPQAPVIATPTKVILSGDRPLRRK